MPAPDRILSQVRLTTCVMTFFADGVRSVSTPIPTNGGKCNGRDCEGNRKRTFLVGNEGVKTAREHSLNSTRPTHRWKPSRFRTTAFSDQMGSLGDPI